MKVIIGIIKGNRNMVEACRIYDTDSCSYKDMSFHKIKNVIENGQRIVGYRLNRQISYSRGGRMNTSLRKEAASFDFNIIPQLNGYGILVNIEDSCINTLLGWTGFAENKHYIVVNWNGTITKLSQSEFKQGVIDRKINGARYDAYNNKFRFCMDLNNEIEINPEKISSSEKQ